MIRDFISFMPTHVKRHHQRQVYIKIDGTSRTAKQAIAIISSLETRVISVV